MDTGVEVLGGQDHRLNSALSQHQCGHHIQSTSSQVDEERTASPAHWISDRSMMAPLIAQYDRHIDVTREELQRYEALTTDVKVRLAMVVKENQSLHTELKESVEEQLQALLVVSGMEGPTPEEETIIRNLQEQLELSEQERVQAVELWQTAAEELDQLQQVHHKSKLNGKVLEAQRKQLKDQLVQLQQNSHQLQVTNQKLESANQQLLKTVTEQSTEMEEQRIQLREAKTELRTATDKVDAMTKLLEDVQNQIKSREKDVAEAQDAANRRLQQLQVALSQLDARLKASSQEAESFRREQTVWERKLGELQGHCSLLEEEKYEALAKVRESIQVVEEAALQKDQALLRESMEKKTKDAIKQLMQDAAARTKKEVENVRKQRNAEIHRITMELSTLQLECADKDSQIERAMHERKAAEEELVKVYKEGRAEPQFWKIDALQQRCLNAERMKEDMSLTLQSTRNKLKKMDMDYNELLSQCKEEVRCLQSSLAAARDNYANVSEERLQLQEENLQLRKQMDELRRTTLLVQKKAKQQVSQIEHEYILKEQGLDARVRELEERSSSSIVGLTCLLKAHQKNTQRWKKETKNLVQVFETKITGLKEELIGQKQRSHNQAVCRASREVKTTP